MRSPEPKRKVVSTLLGTMKWIGITATGGVIEGTAWVLVMKLLERLGG